MLSKQGVEFDRFSTPLYQG